MLLTRGIRIAVVPCQKGLDGSINTWPWHFGQFDLETREVRGSLPSEPLKTYEIRVE
jgi:nitrite reductase/ring-hydroxylating ferredoxin subunit